MHSSTRFGRSISQKTLTKQIDFDKDDNIIPVDKTNSEEIKKHFAKIIMMLNGLLDKLPDSIFDESDEAVALDDETICAIQDFGALVETGFADCHCDGDVTDLEYLAKNIFTFVYQYKFANLQDEDALDGMTIHSLKQGEIVINQLFKELKVMLNTKKDETYYWMPKIF